MHVHKLITNKELRRLYAKELYETKIVCQKNNVVLTNDFLFGLESGFWALQKAIHRGETVIARIDKGDE